MRQLHRRTLPSGVAKGFKVEVGRITGGVNTVTDAPGKIGYVIAVLLKAGTEKDLGDPVLGIRGG